MNEQLNRQTETNHDLHNDGDSHIENRDQEDDRHEDKRPEVSFESITDSAVHLLARYQQLGTQALEVAKLEAKLSIKSLFYTLILMTCFAVCLVVSWIALNAMIGFWLYSLGVTLWIIILGLFFLQILLLVTIWKAISYLTSNIGFSNTLKVSENH